MGVVGEPDKPATVPVPGHVDDGGVLIGEDFPSALIDLFGGELMADELVGDYPGGGGSSAADVPDDDEGPVGLGHGFPVVVPPVVSYEVGAHVLTSREAALSLLLPVTARGFIGAISPADPSPRIGEFQPRMGLPSLPCAARCRIHTHPCSRVRSFKPSELSKAEQVELAQCLVKGRQKDETTPAVTDWHKNMEGGTGNGKGGKGNECT